MCRNPGWGVGRGGWHGGREREVWSEVERRDGGKGRSCRGGWPVEGEDGYGEVRDGRGG